MLLKVSLNMSMIAAVVQTALWFCFIFLFAQGLCFIFSLFADMSSGLKDSQPYCQVDLIPKYGELFRTYLFLV
jgi:hypothetical protein